MAEAPKRRDLPGKGGPSFTDVSPGDLSKDAASAPFAEGPSPYWSRQEAPEDATWDRVEADDGAPKAPDIEPEQASAYETFRPTLTVKPHSISDEAVGDINQDSLGFRPYVEALVRFMRARETQPPLAVAVRAPWGRGKTSFMRMIEGELKRLSPRRLWFRRRSGSPRFATTWLNPWKHNTREELWTAYLATVTSCIRENLGPRRRTALAIRRYFADLQERGQIWEFALRLLFFVALFLLFLWVAVFVGMPTLTATLVDAVFDPAVANTIKSTFGGWLLGLLGLALVIHQGYVHVIQKFNLGLLEYLRTDPSRRTVVSLTQFENELRMLADAKPPDLKVVIFVDDLDRCEPDILWEVLVAQQLAVVSSKCIFILGMDLDVVARTLETILAKHSQAPVEPKDEFGHGRGYRFLEKIIQTRISIPTYGAEQIRGFVEHLVPAGATRSTPPSAPIITASRLDEEPTDDSPELREAVVTYSTEHFSNPREIKRFVNALRLHVYLANASGFETSVDQLARFLVLTERWPGLIREFLISEEWMDIALDPSGTQGHGDTDELLDKIQRVTTRPEFKALLSTPAPISYERLRELCAWYGFEYYGEAAV